VGVAQLVERRSVAPNVAGSIPVSHPKFLTGTAPPSFTRPARPKPSFGKLPINCGLLNRATELFERACVVLCRGQKSHFQISSAPLRSARPQHIVDLRLAQQGEDPAHVQTYRCRGSVHAHLDPSPNQHARHTSVHDRTALSPVPSPLMSPLDLQEPPQPTPTPSPATICRHFCKPS
jgi:hypothetical protein